MPESVKIFEELSSIDSFFREAQYELTTGNVSTQQRAIDYEDFWKKSIGNTLYEKFIKTYTHKMWMISDNTVIDDFSWSPKGVAIKRGPREGWDTAISAYPTAIDGYNKFFDSARELVDVFIEGTVANLDPGTLNAHLPNGPQTFEIIINSAPVDEIYNMVHGPLRYIGRNIEYVVLPVENALPLNVYFAYYTGNEAYTRVVEYKKFTRYQSANTVISLEYPSLTSGKFYPLPVPSQRELHRVYEMLNHQMLFNIGRIAKYNYRYDIDDAIEQVLALSDDVF
jgi:UDP-galactopyranose mutase